MWHGFRNGRYKSAYGQRWQAETVFSMIKRRQGHTLGAQTARRQNGALMLKALTHNILIVRPAA